LGRFGDGETGGREKFVDDDLTDQSFKQHCGVVMVVMVVAVGACASRLIALLLRDGGYYGTDWDGGVNVLWLVGGGGCGGVHVAWHGVGERGSGGGGRIGEGVAGGLEFKVARRLVSRSGLLSSATDANDERECAKGGHGTKGEHNPNDDVVRGGRGAGAGREERIRAGARPGQRRREAPGRVRAPTTLRLLHTRRTSRRRGTRIGGDIRGTLSTVEDLRRWGGAHRRAARHALVSGAAPCA